MSLSRSKENPGSSLPHLPDHGSLLLHTHFVPLMQRAKANQGLQLPGLQVQGVPQHPALQEAREQQFMPCRQGGRCLLCLTAHR